MEKTVIRINRRTLQILGLILLAVFLIFMIYHLRSIFNPVLLALIIAYIFNPLANFLEKMNIRRALTIVTTYFLLFVVLFLVLLVIIPLINAQIQLLYEKTFIGDNYEDINNNEQWDEGEPLFLDLNKNGIRNLGEPLHDVGENGSYDPSYISVFFKYLQDKIRSLKKQYPKSQLEFQSILNQITGEQGLERAAKASVNIIRTATFTALKTILSLFGILSYLVLMPLYIYFLMNSLNGIWETIYKYLPRKQKKEIVRILMRIHRAISAFFRGRLIICVIKGLLTWGCLELLDYMGLVGIRFSLIFGGIQAVATIIPFLVLVVGMVPNLAIVLLEAGFYWPSLLAVLLVYSAVECLEGFVLTPWIMGQETGLHPLTIILSLLIGGKLLGLFGLLVAIPLATTFKILAQELVVPQLEEVVDAKDLTQRYTTS